MLKKIALKKLDIYAILDIKTCRKRNTSKLTQDLIKNNIKIIQLRYKNSSWQEVLKKAHQIKRDIKNKALFIINDYPEICILTDASGVHLGQGDLSLKFARNILGKNKIIGISCHNIRQAELAQRDGADYISFGPIFKTPLKKNYKAIGIKKIGILRKSIKIPFFLIGGIDTSQLKFLKSLKLRRIAVCRALCQSKNINKTIRQLRNYLN
ncbi:MAG: thiamine phosphate synthase [Candidatus Omnitrophica bacterium]|nr:thiamine phosphate synthase [Candidatus Omnitrophota bacterium]